MIQPENGRFDYRRGSLRTVAVTAPSTLAVPAPFRYRTPLFRQLGAMHRPN